MTGTELTVVLTAHNRADVVEGMLQTLAAQEWDADWDIALVDNNSTDNTREVLDLWVDKMPVSTKVISATERQNCSYARSVGVAASEGQSVVFLDDDDLIEPGFVEAVGEALRVEHLVGPRHSHDRLNSSAIARFRGSHQSTRLGETFGVPVASGGGFGCRRSLWERLGGQVEVFGYGAEDSEFCLRASALGVPAAFVPDAVYQVRHRAGIRASFHQARRLSIASVRLYQRCGSDFGAGPDGLAAVSRSWAGLAYRVFSLRDRASRLNWAWQLGRRVGRIQGSLMERTWYP